MCRFGKSRAGAAAHAKAWNSIAERAEKQSITSIIAGMKARRALLMVKPAPWRGQFVRVRDS